jgi:DNA invertase Pin-like site-specific DNA recombinase
MRIAYSYMRYSSVEQEDGDSVRRQTDARNAWLKRHADVRLDTTRTYLDRGRSAYHGRHLQKGGALAAFLAEVERGDIPKGSVLIIENLDRLSREDPWDSVPLLCSLVNAGITVATLSPNEMVFERGSNLTPLILAVVEFGRSHSESASKSSRNIAAWGERQRQVRESGAILTRRLPAWIEERGGKLVLNPERAHIVRRMFELSIRGYGLGLIVRELTRDQVATWGGGENGWNKNYICKILRGRVAIGEFQPTCQGKPAGEPIPDYFPAVVDLNTWHQAQVALNRRKESRQGVYGEKVASLFQGLLVDAATGDRMVVSRQGRTGNRVLRSARSIEGAAPCLSFTAEVFEKAVLSMLKEVDPAAVLGEVGPAKSESVAAKLAIKEQQIRQLDALMDEDGADSPTLGRRVLKLDKEVAELKKELAILRQQESNPLSVAWAESRSLFDVATTEEHRLRLRELLRTIVESIWILIIPRRSHRLCAVQVFFQGDGTRDYLIHYQAAAGGRQGFWNARSLKHDLSGQLDLRNKGHVAALSRMLESVDLTLLAAAMDDATPAVER